VRLVLINGDFKKHRREVSVHRVFGWTFVFVGRELTCYEKLYAFHQLLKGEELSAVEKVKAGASEMSNVLQ
jgi:hypothetical protein